MTVYVNGKGSRLEVSNNVTSGSCRIMTGDITGPNAVELAKAFWSDGDSEDEPAKNTRFGSFYADGKKKTDKDGADGENMVKKLQGLNEDLTKEIEGLKDFIKQLCKQNVEFAKQNADLYTRFIKLQAENRKLKSKSS